MTNRQAVTHEAGWWDAPLVLLDLAKAIPIVSGNGLPLLTENNFQTSPLLFGPPRLLIFRSSVGRPLLLRPLPPIIWNWRVKEDQKFTKRIRYVKVI